MEGRLTFSRSRAEPGCLAVASAHPVQELLAGAFPAVLRSITGCCEELLMANITLLYSPSCGACPSAKSLWKELRVKYSFSYREVDITTTDGQDLANRHSVRAVPATIIDGRLTFVGVPSRQSAEKALQLKMKPQPT